MLQKTMTVLGLFSPTRREVGVVEVAELLGKPKSTISRWLSDMEDAGFLDRDPDNGRYRLSLRLAALGELARHSTSLQRTARPHLEWLTEETGETSNLTVLIRMEAINVDVIDSPRPIMHVGWVGRRLPCHATASGKVLLAWASPDTLAGVLGRGLERLTPETIVDVTAFNAELVRVRARGYATAWAELEPDLAAVGAPVRDHRGTVVAALAIGAPVSRIPRDQLESCAAPVRRAADAVSAQMGWRK